MLRRALLSQRRCRSVEERLLELETRVSSLQPMYGICPNVTPEEYSRIYGEWEYFVRRNQSPVSIAQVLPKENESSADHLVNLARYVYHEIPIRLAHRGRDLDRLPYGLSHMEPVRELHRSYFQSFCAMRQLETPSTTEDLVNLLPVLREILARHGRTLEHIARGIYNLKQALRPTADINPHLFHQSGLTRARDKGWWLSNFPRLQTFLNTFNESRIGTRFLIAHLMEVIIQEGSKEGWLPPDKGFRYSSFGHDIDTFTGLVHKDMDSSRVITHSIDQVSKEAEAVYGTAPKVILNTHGINEGIPFVPLYLNTMMTELLKNSMRAVIEKHGRFGAQNGSGLITVTVCVSENKKLTIRVDDKGGGIRRSHIDLTQSYLYTTARPAYADNSALEVKCSWENTEGTPHTAPPLSSVPCAASPFAGYGYGLPITRCISSYFGGQFELISQEGLGTSAYIYLDPVLAYNKNLQ
eukprot:TRINITY_DN1278_c9_g1_i1.p1 TRINITY_DN1278_c9_g1~~TRINITY_DN1278_c9_g1_i1.p1  ORF type:complete len:481 (+),score=28.80 TRINITY_DN1278_c9_g1_i1:41-1444(+)